MIKKMPPPVVWKSIRVKEATHTAVVVAATRRKIGVTEYIEWLIGKKEKAA